MGKDGRFLPNEWAAYAMKKDVCEIGLSHPNYVALVMGVFFIGCMADFQSVIDLYRTVRRMRHTGNMEDMIVVESGNIHLGGTLYVVAVTSCVRTLLVAVVALKFCIVVYVLMLGCKLLCASSCLPDVVLNALAVQFVLEIDRWFFEAFLPKEGKRTVRDTYLFECREKMTLGTSNSKTTRDRVGTLAWVAVIVGFLTFYLHVFQQVMPPDMSVLTDKCRSTVAYEQICTEMAFAIRGNHEKCYPYGTGWTKPRLI